MSCRYYAEKDGDDYCTAKGGYISGYCGYDDTSCRYYPNSEDTVDCDCPYWGKGGYCSAKGGYVSGDCSYGYTSCTYYKQANGKSGCYLTTACVTYKGLPDNCEELTILREFRDKYLKSFKAGRKDIKEYYRVAPEIVKAISARENAKEIWEDIYNNLVVKSIELIKAKKYSEAHYYYKDFSEKLFNRYVKCFICNLEELKDTDVTVCKFRCVGGHFDKLNGEEKRVIYCAAKADLCIAQK